MQDKFPSITAEDISHASDLIGTYGNRLADYPPDLKADLVQIIRREVRTMQTTADGHDLGELTEVATEIHPDLLAFVEKAERDCPEE